MKREADSTALRELREARETCWINPGLTEVEKVRRTLLFSPAQVEEAAARLRRFAPFLMQAFPETKKTGGLIESPLRELAAAREALAGKIPEGRLLMKMDSHLAIAGSVKARGGIYEVLKHTEDIALREGILSPGDDYSLLRAQRALFSRYTVQVGSTGNLGLSIGISSAQIGYRVIVHMSQDARQWKKDLLRKNGVQVEEYAGDYGKAVEEGRRRSNADPKSYFVDDEHSSALFLGYAVAGERLREQLEGQGITVDAAHPLLVYIPCGVGGAPGGITFGLKLCFGDNVHVFFVEPTQCPCMLAGMATGEREKVCVQDFGLTGITEADGLAVGRPSGMVAQMMEPLLSGIFTVEDSKLFDFLRMLHASEGIFIEPSACAAFAGYLGLRSRPEARDYLRAHDLEEKMPEATHVLWATGGSLVPPETAEEYLRHYPAIHA